MWGTAIENMDGISKTQKSIVNLKEYQKYQNSFVSFDAESNFEQIYNVCLIDHLGALYVDHHQFFCVPRSPHQNFDVVLLTV